jgi:hypothetical protein
LSTTQKSEEVHEEEALSVEGNRTNKLEGWPETKRKGCEAPPTTKQATYVNYFLTRPLGEEPELHGYRRGYMSDCCREKSSSQHLPWTGCVDVTASSLVLLAAVQSIKRCTALPRSGGRLMSSSSITLASSLDLPCILLVS